MASTVQHNTLAGTEVHEPKGAATAAADRVYVSDGLGSGSWTTLPAGSVDVTDAGGYFAGSDVEAVLQELGAQFFTRRYAELYITNNTTAETATGSAVDWTTNWVAGVVTSGMTQDVSAGSITVDDAGKYAIMASLSFYQSGASAADWTIQVEVNGTAVTKTQARHTTSATDVVAATISGILDLAASDVVTISITRNSGAVNPIVNYANVTLLRVA